jgi:hypothetical protein
MSDRWWENDAPATVTDARKVVVSADPSTGIDARRLSPQEGKQLNAVRDEGRAGLGMVDVYRRAADAIDRFGTSPMRAAMYEATTPRDGGGFFDRLGGVVGEGAKALGLMSQDRQDDFQFLQSLQQRAVLEGQIAQKGVQTDADAARLMLSDFSPYKSVRANAEIVRGGMLSAQLAARKPGFYAAWANRYGLNGLDPRGRSVDDAWLAMVEDARGRLAPARRRPRAAAGKAGARKAGRVVDFNDLPE